MKLGTGGSITAGLVAIRFPTDGFGAGFAAAIVAGFAAAIVAGFVSGFVVIIETDGDEVAAGYVGT